MNTRIKLNPWEKAQARQMQKDMTEETNETALAQVQQSEVTELVVDNSNALGIYGGDFTQAQRVAKAICSSDFVPKQFKGDIANTLVAMDFAQRLNMPPLMVMQSLYVIHGKPAWASNFVAGLIESCGRFEPIEYVIEGEGDERGCYIKTSRLGSTVPIVGPRVTVKQAKDEGWFGRSGSKWATLTDLMLSYRAVTFFGRLYASDRLLGLKTQDEIIDIEASETRAA